MNKVFLIGKIINEIKYDFIINSRHIAISRFEIKTIDGQIVNIKAYDKLADYIFSKINVKDVIFIYGKLKHDYIEAISIEIFFTNNK